MKTSFYLVLMGIMFVGCDNSSDPIVIPTENLEATVQYRSIPGVDANLNSLDIYYTSNLSARQPVVIWVHGGGWAIGDKANKMDQKINLFRDLEGYVLVSLNYRLSPNPYELDNDDRIMFPTHNQDIAVAIKWVYDNIADYGGDQFRLALLGHSAGAHLVSLTGTRHTFLEDVGLSLSSLKGVAAIDTEGYNMITKMMPENRQDFHINAFGLDETRYADASPIEHIKSSKSHPGFFIAKRGTPRRVGEADAFIQRLEQSGVAVTEVEGSAYDHEGINDAIGDVNDAIVTPPLVAFFEEVFR